VDNWEFFDGSLLAVGFREGNDVLKIEGTPIMIGPGLAISAKHVYEDRLDALLEGKEVMYCVGLRPGGLLTCGGFNTSSMATTMATSRFCPWRLCPIYPMAVASIAFR
jgi:hypothetical protein